MSCSSPFRYDLNEFKRKTMIENVKMSTEKITIITIYAIIKQPQNRGGLSPSDPFITCG